MEYFFRFLKSKKSSKIESSEKSHIMCFAFGEKLILRPFLFVLVKISNTKIRGKGKRA